MNPRRGKRGRVGGFVTLLTGFAGCGNGPPVAASLSLADSSAQSASDKLAATNVESRIAGRGGQMRNATRMSWRLRVLLGGALLPAMLGGGCQSMNNTDKGILAGGGLGAVAGALAGGPRHAGIGALAGGVIGA